MTSEERCPTCRSTIYYPTDTLGYVIAWCYRCRTSPQAQYVTIMPTVRPATAEESTEKVLAYLQREPNNYHLAYQIRDALNIADHTIRRALMLLVERGAVAVVERTGYKRPYYTINV